MAVSVPCGLSSCTVIRAEGGAQSASRLRAGPQRGQNQASALSLSPTCSLRQRDDDSVSSEVQESRASFSPAWAGHLGKHAIAALAAGLLLVSPGDATAASGGRVGGSAYRSDRSGPSRTYDNSRTNIYIRPPPLVGPPPVIIAPPPTFAPPVFGGYGFGGFGLPFFGPPPVVVGPTVAVGFSLFDLLPVFLGIVVLGGIASLFRRRDDYD